MINAPLVKNIARLRYMRTEALRVGGLSPEISKYIRQQRLDICSVIAVAGWINVALVKYWTGNDGDEAFQFDPDGIPSVVIEAILFDYDREPFCADLVAWPMSRPDYFITAMGQNDGADVLGPQSMVGRRGAPLRIWRTPLHWLQAGGEGCVLLKPGARHWLRRAGGPFVAEDLEHGREIRDLLGRDGSRHQILVPGEKVTGRAA